LRIGDRSDVKAKIPISSASSSSVGWSVRDGFDPARLPGRSESGTERKSGGQVRDGKNWGQVRCESENPDLFGEFFVGRWSVRDGFDPACLPGRSESGTERNSGGQVRCGRSGKVIGDRSKGTTSDLSLNGSTLCSPLSDSPRTRNVDNNLCSMPINFRRRPPGPGEINVNSWRARGCAPPQVGPKNG
jgi:hypothetical protein